MKVHYRDVGIKSLKVGCEEISMIEFVSVFWIQHWVIMEQTIARGI